MNAFRIARSVAADAGGPARPAKGGNVIAVASGKGGVGKTWFAVTLAHALARAGERVLLFDGDLGAANVDVQLGLMPLRDLGGVVAGRLSLAQARTRYGEAQFDVVPGCSGAGGLAQLPPGRLLELGDEFLALARSYGTVVMDVGAGVERTVRMLTARAESVLVLATPDPAALADAYAFIKVSHADDPEADLRLVINLVESRVEGEMIHEGLRKACASFLGVEPPLAGVVRRDGHVSRAIRAQLPILLRYPASDAARDVEAIADRLLRRR